MAKPDVLWPLIEEAIRSRPEDGATLSFIHAHVCGTRPSTTKDTLNNKLSRMKRGGQVRYKNALYTLIGQ